MPRRGGPYFIQTMGSVACLNLALKMMLAQQGISRPNIHRSFELPSKMSIYGSQKCVLVHSPSHVKTTALSQYNSCHSYWVCESSLNANNSGNRYGGHYQDWCDLRFEVLWQRGNLRHGRMGRQSSALLSCSWRGRSCHLPVISHNLNLFSKA